MLTIKDLPNKSLSRNEVIQWIFILGSLGFIGVTVVSFWYQIKANRMQIRELEKKELRDHTPVQVTVRQ